MSKLRFGFSVMRRGFETSESRSEQDRTATEWQNEVATLLLVDPVYNSRREAVLEANDGGSK